jgi:heterotetrameric sarcosine oxidase delta subunit
MIILPCPNCGERNVSEFRFGGELTKRPAPEQMTPESWTDYLYMRRNVLGVQREWWYHDACGCWFIAERHTKTHDVAKTYFWTPEK